MASMMAYASTKEPASFRGASVITKLQELGQVGHKKFQVKGLFHFPAIKATEESTNFYHMQ